MAHLGGKYLEESSARKGKVTLVGAGPGDPGLITLKGMEALSRADVVVYDHLASEELLDLAPRDAEFIYVGKKAGQHSMAQEAINKLLVEKAKAGLCVVRLKGGDPFIFGRGGEELEELSRAGIDFEVVPGITSAIAVPAYAGIPLTHRAFTSVVSFVTGHEKEEKDSSAIDWPSLARMKGTIVFLMGAGNLAYIVENLLKNGLSPKTPIAIIYKGTTPEQKTTVSSLGSVLKETKGSVKPPSIIVVGDVVSLREGLRWFDKRPLFGRKIIVTRARDQASTLVKRLKDLGAEVMEFPTISIVPPDSYGPLDRAIGQLDYFHWVLFTSANGVKAFFQRLNALKMDSRALAGKGLGVIGPGTEAELRLQGLIPDLVPERFVAEGILEAFKRLDIKGKQILIPRAQEARDVLVRGLEEMGAGVWDVPAYKTVIPEIRKEVLEQVFLKAQADLITFTSSSTVSNLVRILGLNNLPVHEIIGRLKAACIGPITEETAKGYGFDVIIRPEIYTIEALVGAIRSYYLCKKEEDL